MGTWSYYGLSSRGSDDLIRVVSIKISRSEYKWPVAKLCFLPVAINTEEANESVMEGGSSI